MSFSPGGGGGISAASDVALSNPSNNQVLTYNGSTGKWANATPSGGSPTLATMPAGSMLVAPLDGTVNTNANMARPSARTDIFFRWRSTVQPNNMISGDEWYVVS